MTQSECHWLSIGFKKFNNFLQSELPYFLLLDTVLFYAYKYHCEILNGPELT